MLVYRGTPEPEDKLQNLHTSIKRHGVERPVIADTGKHNAGGYSWIEGFHRALVSRKLGLETVPLYLRVE